jgi:hypothetical protein
MRRSEFMKRLTLTISSKFPAKIRDNIFYLCGSNDYQIPEVIIDDGMQPNDFVLVAGEDEVESLSFLIKYCIQIGI